MINLMIADNHTIVREGLKKLFDSEKNMNVIAEAGDESECLNVLSVETPDLLILDFNISLTGEMEVLKKLNENENRLVKILVLTGNTDLRCLLELIEIGIDGYILKKSGFMELKNAIISIMKGEKYIQTDFADLLNGNANYAKNDFDKISNLTNRELDVLKNLSVGMYNKEIALKLGISERTVKNHISNIFKKIGVADRTQAAVFAIRNYLVDIYK